MHNEEIIEKNGGKKFDAVLMNPPYGSRETGGMFLDVQFVKKINEVCHYQIVVHPANRLVSNTPIAKKNIESGHLKEYEIFDANEVFQISTNWKYGAVYVYDNFINYETIIFIKENKKTLIKNDDFAERLEFFNNIFISNDVLNIIEKLSKLRNELFSKYKTMVNDGHGFVYEDNDIKRGKKKYNIIKNDSFGYDWGRIKNVVIEKLKSGKYKYCVYKGSFNNSYNKPQEWLGQDPDKLFKGQICWLTNKENVKNNLIYWMECPLFDLWRKYYFGKDKRAVRISSGCAYGLIPALDFEMNEDDFKKYVDSLNDFSEDEIRILKEYNVHNANLLKN